MNFSQYDNDIVVRNWRHTHHTPEMILKNAVRHPLQSRNSYESRSLTVIVEPRFENYLLILKQQQQDD